MTSCVSTSVIGVGGKVAMAFSGVGVSTISGGDVEMISIGVASSAAEGLENVQITAVKAMITAAALSRMERLGLFAIETIRSRIRFAPPDMVEALQIRSALLADPLDRAVVAV